MAQIALNKSELKKQNDRLKTFKKFLPSLDLKRKQIIAERNKAQKLIEALYEEMAAVDERLKTQYAMVAESGLSLEDLVTVKNVRLGKENIVGVYLPTFEGQDIEVKVFEELTAPHWLGSLSHDMNQATALRFRIKIAEIRLNMLEKALQKTTQRLNLFDKVLIPETKGNITKIKIYLSDFERASVVQAKIAKGKSVSAEEEAYA